MLKTTLTVPNNFIYTLREGYWVKFCMKLIGVIFQNNYYSFIALLLNWYNNRLLPLIMQFFLIPNRIIDFMIILNTAI
jgi:hypothetical protein